MSSLILVFGAIGAISCLAMLGLGVMGRRAPVLGYIGMPLFVLIIASVATVSGAGSTLSGLDSADISQLSVVANTGLKSALATDASGRLWAAGVLTLAVWCAAIPVMVRSGQDWGWTIVDTVFALILIIGGAIATLVLGTKWGIAAHMTPVLGVLVVGGAGIAVASLRRGLFDDAERVAAYRFAAGVAFLGAIGQIGHYVSLSAEVDVIGKALAASPDSLDTIMLTGLETVNRVYTLSWLAWGFGFLIALCALFMELGEAVQKYLVIDGAAVTALAAVMLIARGVEIGSIAEVREVGNLAPMVHVLGELGVELPAAAVAMNGALADARPAEGGFGDILVLEKSGEGDDVVVEWIRRFVWTGTGWEADETPLAQATLTAKPVLLAANSSMPAEHLFEAMDKAPAGAMLLMRMGEMDTDVPEMAQQRNASYLPLVASTQADPANQLWARADKRGLYHGPVRWYGEGDEQKDLIARTDAAFEQTESPGLTVVVNDRAMIRQVADFCLATIMTVQDEAVVPREGVWCELMKGDFEEFRTKANEGWEVPKPEGVRLSMKVDERLDEGTAQLLANEIGGLAYCQQKAVDFGEEEGLSGRYIAEFEINQRGKIGWHEPDEKSKLENRVLRKCIRQRLDTVVWAEHEVETDPDNEEDYTSVKYTLVYGDPPPPSVELEEEEEVVEP